MAKVVDIEPYVKQLLVTNGKTAGNIYLQEFPVDVAGDGLYMIRRTGSGSNPKNIDVDVAIVRIWARDSDPHTAFTNQKSIADLLHGLNPVTVTVSSVAKRFLYGELSSGPDRDDDADRDVPQWAASYLLRVAA